MINISELMSDSDFSTNFKIIRQSGRWENRRWLSEETEMLVTGIVMGVSKKDIAMVPEGNRLNEMRVFYSAQELVVSSDEALSDICEYKGIRYRLIQGFDYGDYGYYKALGVKLGGV